MGLPRQIHERAMEALLHLDVVDDALGDEAVKGIIITSGKKISPEEWT